MQHLWVVGGIVLVALVFDYINGFHDAANSIATVVSTRVLSPGKAVIWAAFFNFVAAFVFGTGVAQTIGKAQYRAFKPRRIGVMIVGDEVPHTHIHVVPINSAGELSFAHADHNPPEGALEEAAEKIRAALRDMDAEYVAE